MAPVPFFSSYILFCGLLLVLPASTGCGSGGADASLDPGRAVRPASPDDPVAFAEPVPTGRRRIVFFGNSLTAAYGIAPDDGYVALLQHRLDSLRLPYLAVNAGLSGETTAGGRQRIDWVLRDPVDIFVLELGGNDALRGIDPTESYANLSAILQTVRDRYPQARLVLAGMQAPPNLGPAYATAFRDLYPRIARETGAALIPFFLDGVGGVPELNLADRIHPNEKGQLLLLENVWTILAPLLSDSTEKD